MSNIFNLLDETVKSDKDHMVKPVVSSKTSHEVRSSLVKTMGGAKPKGLSMRSISDMNISHNTHLVNKKKNIFGNKEQEFQKLKVTQIDSSGRPISPGRKVTQIDSSGRPISPGKEIPTNKLITQKSKVKHPTLKEQTALDKSMKTQKISNDIFKIPLPSKKFVKKLPEPENLAYYYEEQDDIDHDHIEVIEKELKNLFLKKNDDVMPHEGKKVISDSETLISPEIPRFILSKPYDRECIALSSPELPEISDDDNF